MSRTLVSVYVLVSFLIHTLVKELFEQDFKTLPGHLVTVLPTILGKPRKRKHTRTDVEPLFRFVEFGLRFGALYGWQQPIAGAFIEYKAQ